MVIGNNMTTTSMSSSNNIVSGCYGYGETKPSLAGITPGRDSNALQEACTTPGVSAEVDAAARLNVWRNW